MSVKGHYDNHLGNIYSWMLGDLAAKQEEAYNFFLQQGIVPSESKVAIDLGAGNGLQTVPLAWLGFHVIAIDFNMQLLTELSHNAAGYNVDVVNTDIRHVGYYAKEHPELIICMGDTLTHLDNREDVERLIENCFQTLEPSGMLVLSFRDYSTPLEGDARFIPVKSDDTRILTCFLEYSEEHVKVTDLLYERHGERWQQKVSSYQKLRLLPSKVEELLLSNSFSIKFNEPVAGMYTIIACKENIV